MTQIGGNGAFPARAYQVNPGASPGGSAVTKPWCTNRAGRVLKAAVMGGLLFQVGRLAGGALRFDDVVNGKPAPRLLGDAALSYVEMRQNGPVYREP